MTAGPVGFLGGTFDPVHIGHLAVAEEAREALGLARVLFVPAGVPPHKAGRAISPAADRVAMVELAIADNPAFALCRAEVDRPGLSYTVDTVERLLPELGEVTVIVSTELLGGLRTWKDPERLLRIARLAVVPRPGHPATAPEVVADHFPGLEERVTFLDGPHLGLSASEIRARSAAGRSIRYLVPDAVSAYIGDHGLYRADARRKP